MNVDFFSLGSEFNVISCFEVGMSLHVNSCNPSYIVGDFMGSHGSMQCFSAFFLSNQSYKVDKPARLSFSCSLDLLLISMKQI